MTRRGLLAVVALSFLAPTAPGTAQAQTEPARSYAQVVLDDGPSWYWRLGEAEGRSHDQAGGVGSSAQFGQQVDRASPGAIAGDPDGSVDLPGAVSDRIWQSHVYADWDGTYTSAYDRSPFAVEIWAAPRSLDARSRRIVSREQPAGGYLVAARTDATVFSRYVRTPAGLRWSTISAPVLPIGAWTHIVALYDGTEMRLYLDGRLAGKRVSTLSLPADRNAFGDRPAHFMMGAHSDGWLEWDGRLDEAAFYSYRGLSAEQIADHHAVGVGRAGG